jgi:gamma-glutamyltranspeptidase/glutathione hydrolase
VTRVAVATTSQLAADAAQEVAASGGNAVDCALAAALMTMNTEPGVCALAGSAYVTVWKPGHDAVTIDGNTAIPGLGLAIERRDCEATTVTLDYGGGITTLVGAGSVAVPGSVAAIERAWQHYGQAQWPDLFAPTIAATRMGFSLSSASHYYLGYSGEPIFGRADDGFFALHKQDRSLYDPGSLIVIPHLADSLTAIAEGGARVFYEGELAKAMTAHVAERGGALTPQDLAHYEAVERRSLAVDVGTWTIASNPPPAVGGTSLAAMLLACSELPYPDWRRKSLARLIEVQRAVLDYRKHNLDLTDDIGAAADALLTNIRAGRLPGAWTSASTVHTSAVDDTGLGCAVTASSGYGSGEMPRDTGIWLNNCLGELELNRRGLAAGPPGARLPSNMAPSIARRDGTVLAVGSPGADRITTALHQFLVNHLQLDMSLEDAIAHPRVHIDTSGSGERLMAEAGLDLPDVDMPVQIMAPGSMYFGGVAAARFDRHDGFGVAADPRREGGTSISPA